MKTLITLLIAVTISFSTFAQSSKSEGANNQTDTIHNVKYTCTMHPEIISDQPGKCSKCGMELTKVKTYSCSMHPEVVSDKPGKCPKCNMELTEVKEKPKSKKS